MAKMSNLPTIDVWLETDNLILLEGWARDGWTVEDIAFKIGVDKSTLRKWMRDNDEIRKAINDGRELVDYKVENALLKAALGYKTKEVKVITTIRNGKLLETIKETTTTEAAPNVQACKVWLYNRQPKKWKPESVRGQSLLDAMDEDNDIRITIERAGSREQELAQANQGDSVRIGVQSNANDEVDEQWQDEVNQSVTIRKATEQEQQARRANAQQKKEGTKVELDSQDKAKRVPKPNKRTLDKHAQSNTTQDIDYWPDDWVDEDE